MAKDKIERSPRREHIDLTPTKFAFLVGEYDDARCRSDWMDEFTVKIPKFALGGFVKDMKEFANKHAEELVGEVEKKEAEHG